MYLLALLVWITGASIVAEKRSYKIVKLDEAFRYSDSYHWRSIGQPEAGGKALQAFSTIRVDEMTSKWDLSNSTVINSKLYEVYNSTSHLCPVFHPERFLSLLRNKKLGIFGDSLSLQLFEGLSNCLTPHVSAYLNISGGVEVDAVKPDGKVLKSIRGLRLSVFNATIYFCWDHYLLFKKTTQSDPECIHAFSDKTDVFVIGVGAWFKPKFINEHEDMSYNESYTKSRAVLANNIRETRKKINATTPHAKVIWRNHPHVGRLDEWKYLHNVSEGMTIQHGNGLLWTNTSLGAHWVPVYNEIIVKQAKIFGDFVLDWYSLSLQYIDMFSRAVPKVAVHIDSLHYFADGLPRGAALLLQDALYDLSYKHKW